MRDVLTFILAGGKGERLDPLTRDRAKPAVPFGAFTALLIFRFPIASIPACAVFLF